MTKICKSCGITKSLNEFNKQKGSRDGLSYKCKSCIKIFNDTYYQSNRIQIIENKKKYQRDNIEQYQKSQKISREKHKNKYKDRKRKYDQNYKSIKNQKRLLKYKTDFIYKIECLMRSHIHRALKSRSFIKKNKTTIILGCSYDHFKQHLESLFEPWMTWDNHGLYNGADNYGWDIDHIIPISSASSEQDLIKLSHYTNLRPLCSKINRNIKRGKL